MRKILTIALLYLHQFLFCQEMPKIIPPSPEAASLFKFNEIPVSLSSGLHNVSIPLLEVSSGGVNLPIHLGYHSRGVIVNEISSRVGSGWALNYGGMISRQIRGKADDVTFGYHGNNNSKPSFYSNISGRADIIETNAQNNVFFDAYPDKFMINTNFFSGEFYFDKNSGEIITQKFSDIKITPIRDNKIVGFKVIDNLGNVYYFGGLNYAGEASEMERTVSNFTSTGSNLTSVNGTNDSESPYSSWFLTKIITSTNQEIDFIYENEMTTFYRRNSDTNQYSQSSNTSESIVVPVSCNFSQVESYQKVLSEIIFNEGKIKFVNSQQTRLDVNGGHTLEKIVQYDKKNKIIKQIHLEYEYTTALNTNNINNNFGLLNDEFAKKRLFLKSIKHKDDSGLNTERKHSFEYDDQILPSRHSNEIDFWGYYNGKNRGNFINSQSTQLGDAVVDPTKVQAGLLKKITYPTGGSSSFEYEPNIVLNKLPLSTPFIEDASISRPLEYQIANTNPVYDRNETLSFINPELYNNTTLRYEMPILIKNIKGTLKTNLSVNGIRYRCELVNNNDTAIRFVLPTGINNITVLPGTYTLIFKPDVYNWNPYSSGNLDNTMNNFFNVHLSWSELEFDNKQIVYGPGNRIKKITNYTADSNVEFSKLYAYNDETTNLPNGALLTTANYRILRYRIGQMPIYENEMFTINGTFGSFSKDNLGYYNVSEYFLDKNNTIKDKIQYKYSMLYDFGAYYKFPFHPVSDNDWLRGLELSKEVYKKENGTFIKCQEIKNDYLVYNQIQLTSNSNFFLPQLMPYNYEITTAYSNNIPFPYLKNKTQFCYPSSMGFNLNHYVFNSTSNYGYRTSFFIGGTLDLKATTVTDYFNSSSIVTTTNYEYDYAKHYNVAKTKTTNSNGDLVETKYSYAPDLNNTALNDKNMKGIPLKTETFKNGIKLSTQETTYKNWENILLAPEIVKAAKGSNAMEDKIKYNLVDHTNGNPLELQQVDNIKICYIWGYNKTLPIAKIENATYASIPTSTITNLQDLSNTGTEANLILALNNLRTSLPNAMVTTFTHRPLVGVSTVTDPKGDKQSYYYDNFNRLQFVKDKNDKILSENQYHYKN